MARGGASNFFWRIMPQSLVGQLVLATAVLLFIGQAVSFAMLARGEAEQRAMRFAVPAANRIVEAQDRITVGQEPIAQRRGRRGGRILTSVNAEPIVIKSSSDESRIASQVEQLLEEANLPDIDVRAASYQESGDSEAIQSVKAMRDGRIQRLLSEPERSGRRERNQRAFKMDGERDDGMEKGGWPTDRVMVISAHLSDGRWLNVAMRAPDDKPFLLGLLGGQTMLLYLLLLAPIAWIGWRVSRPLKQLTSAARETNPLAIGEAVPESGPADVRQLTKAFNTMRRRLAEMLGEKDRMLGALGHDLRTPLASLRVRVESVDDDNLRTKMIGTMDEMAAMLDDILALARSGQNKDAMVATDIGAFLSAIVEDYRETGSDVTLADPPDHLVRTVDVVPLRRAVRNLVDNAMKYGERARVDLVVEAGRAIITIADDGPGIPDDRITEMLEPFTRAEESRSRETGGAGLGLALAKAMVSRQGGDLTLSNAPEGGLVARIDLG